MKFGEIWDKFELYIMSLWFLFFLIIVITVDIPMCFGDNCQFIGFLEVIKKNIVPAISLLLVLFGIIFFTALITGFQVVRNYLLKLQKLKT